MFLLLTATVFLSVFPEFYPQGGAAVWLVQSVVFVFLFFSSLLFHELSHSLIAVRNYIDVLNITFHMFGATARILKEPDEPFDEVKMAVAGPLTSFLISAVFYGASLTVRAASEPLRVVFSLLSAANLGVGIFNLLPAYPLDGGRLLRALIWSIVKSRLKATILAARFSAAISAILFGLGAFYAFSVSIDGLWICLLSAVIFFLSREGVEVAYQNEILEMKLSEVIDIKELPLLAVFDNNAEKFSLPPSIWIDADTRVYDALMSLRMSSHKLVRIVLDDDVHYMVASERLKDMIYEKLEKARDLVK